MREISKMCRICLSQGSRNIFEQTLGSNLLPSRDDLSRIAEKLRFVTMLKINPKENLPQQICDLCIVQLNVSYNFKRLALKNDFQIRQYMIENGMSLSRDDDDSMETTTALEIHQIQHNVIRTNRYRQITVPEIRRNSTTSSVSGASTTLMMNGRESDVTPNRSTTNFATPRPIVRPIQIKTEPIDPDEQEAKEASPVTSSPSTASEPASIVTISSSLEPSEKHPPPMVVINGVVNNESFVEKPEKTYKYVTGPAPLSVKLGRPRKDVNKSPEMSKQKSHNLRTIKKPDVLKKNKKVRQAIEKTIQRESPRISSKKENVKKLKRSNFRVVSKENLQAPKKRGRPRKLPEPLKRTYKKKTQTGNKKS